MTGNIVIGQSGGPTSVINSSAAGVYCAAKAAGVEKIYGMVYGIQGFLDDKLLDLDEYLGTEEGIALMKRTPAAFLGSCRFKLPPFAGNENLYEKIFLRMEQYNISYMFYIGGNDSMDTVKMLSDYAKRNNKKQKFIGVPKTIDNDLPITDHCPGYGSAAKYIATSVREIIRDNAVYGDYRTSILIVEIMGRNAGWLTAASALCKNDTCEGVDLIYLPEVDFDMEAFLKKVKALASVKKSIVIAVSEGIHFEDGTFVCEMEDHGNEGVDVFGHKQLSGCGVYLAAMIQKRLPYKARAVELSTLQRAAAHMTSRTDINEAFMAGEAAFGAAEKGVSGKMVVFTRTDNPYTCGTDISDIHNIANTEKKVPLAWIGEDGCSVTKEYLDYARPLIQGELTPIFEDGMPKHLVRK